MSIHVKCGHRCTAELPQLYGFIDAFSALKIRSRYFVRPVFFWFDDYRLHGRGLSRSTKSGMRCSQWHYIPVGEAAYAHSRKAKGLDSIVCVKRP